MTYVESSVADRTHQPGWLWFSTIILMIGAAMRLVALSGVPPGLAQDEVLNADIVSFIRGGEHTFFFRYGYGHEPLYHYWSVPFQILLGDNVLSIRLPAVFLGLVLIALTLRWARRDFGLVAALVTGFGLAVSWWPVVFSRIGLRPIMEPVLLVCAVLLWPGDAQASSRRRSLQAIVTGVIFGLSLYTYTAARVLFALPISFGIYCVLLSWVTARRKHMSPEAGAPGPAASITTPAYWQQAQVALVVLVTMAVVSLPLFLTLRHDPSLQQRVDQLSGPLDAVKQGDFRPIISTSLATLGYFGISGDPRWTYSVPGRPLFEPLAAALFLAGLVVALWRWRTPVLAFLLIWLMVAVVPSAVTPDAPSSVRLVGAMPAIFVVPGLAVAALWDWARLRYPGSKAAHLLLMGGLTAVALLALGRTLVDGFIRWPAALDTRLKYQTVIRDISLDERIGDGPPVVADGFYEPIDDATLRRNLNGDPQARWVQTGGGASGALVWPNREGSTPGGSTYLFVPEFAPPNPDLMARAGVTAEPYRSAGSPSYAVYSLPAPPVVAAAPISFGIDGQEVIQLNAVSRAAAPVSDTQSGPLELYTDWRILRSLPPDLAIFIHVLDAAGDMVVQYDGLDAAAETLRAGDRMLQRHVLDLPNNLNDGLLTLRLGLYRRSDGTRLLTTDQEGMINFGSCLVQTNDDGEQKVSCDLPEDR